MQATPDGGVCRIPAGTYDITQPIRLEGRRNLTIDGGGSRLVCRYRSGSASGESSDAFYLLDCEGVTVRRFVIDTDRPVNLAGRVVRIAATGGVVMEGNRLEHYTAVPGCAPYETPWCTGVSCVPVCGEEENGNILASGRD